VQLGALLWLALSLKKTNSKILSVDEYIGLCFAKESMTKKKCFITLSPGAKNGSITN
jgi:hypothetical protein